MRNSESYYRIEADDKHSANRWFLDEPVAEDGEEIDAREFISAVPYRGPRPRIVPIDEGGKRVAFNLAAFDMPVVSREVADAIERLSPGVCEHFPVLIDSHIDGYEILNVLPACRCVDENRTLIERWTEEDGRPDKVGQYRTMLNLTIDPTRVSGRDIFRVAGWEIALIVSGRLRRDLEQIKRLGLEFVPVTRGYQ